MVDDLTCVDLFAGAGGFSLGFEHAGFNILVASDYHSTAEETYTYNLDHSFVQTDITDLSENVGPLLDEGEFDSEDIDVLVGGPPCKGFSTAGVYDPDDPRNSLLNHYIKLVRKLRPRAIVVENVTGARSIADGRYVQDLLSETRKMGYNTRMLELNAANFGVPQLRERLFFIGFKNGFAVSRPPQTHAGNIGQLRLGSTAIQEEYITTEEAISDLAFLRPGESSTSYKEPPQSQYQQAMRCGNGNELHNHVAPDHKKMVRERFRTIDEGETMDDLPPRLQTQKHTLMKLDRQKPANTVTTLPEDFVHYEKPRVPTVRELARLQSFPDWFEFQGPRTTGGPQRVESLPQYSQVGNAVPPVLAEAVATHIRAIFRDEDPEVAAKDRIKRFSPD